MLYGSTPSQTLCMIPSFEAACVVFIVHSIQSDVTLNTVTGGDLET